MPMLNTFVHHITTLFSEQFPSTFLFRLLPLGVATSDFPFSFDPFFCNLFHHFIHCHVLSHCIHIIISFYAFPVSSFLTVPSSASFSQYTHHLSSVGTCPNHLCLVSRVFPPNRPTCDAPLMYSFLIVYIRVFAIMYNYTQEISTVRQD